VREREREREKEREEREKRERKRKKKMDQCSGDGAHTSPSWIARSDDRKLL